MARRCFIHTIRVLSSAELVGALWPTIQVMRPPSSWGSPSRESKMEERGYAGLYTGATCSSLGSGLMHTCAAVCARTCQCLAVTEASRCPLTVLFAEAFHGWTTGTLVWRQRCATSTPTSGELEESPRTSSRRVDCEKCQTISHTSGGEYQGRSESQSQYQQTSQMLRRPLSENSL